MKGEAWQETLRRYHGVQATECDCEQCREELTCLAMWFGELARRLAAIDGPLFRVRDKGRPLPFNGCARG